MECKVRFFPSLDFPVVKIVNLRPWLLFVSMSILLHYKIEGFSVACRCCPADKLTEIDWLTFRAKLKKELESSRKGFKMFLFGTAFARRTISTLFFSCLRQQDTISDLILTWLRYGFFVVVNSHTEVSTSLLWKLWLKTGRFPSTLIHRRITRTCRLSWTLSSFPKLRF